MKDNFNPKAEPRMVFVPSHTVRYVDAGRCYEDGISGKIGNISNAEYEARYTYNLGVAGQTIAFSGWENIPKTMPKETRELLSKVMDDEDCALHTPMPTMRPLSFRMPGVTA
jgi:hypothetical protein